MYGTYRRLPWTESVEYSPRGRVSESHYLQFSRLSSTIREVSTSLLGIERKTLIWREAWYSGRDSNALTHI